MSGGAQAAGERFTLPALTNYADPAQMALWIESAPAGAELMYATGPWLGGHAAAALARDWAARGVAVLWQTRATRAHCFDYHARKLPVRPVSAVPDALAPDDVVAGDAGRMLAHLAEIAATGDPCPSNEGLSDALALGSKWRARHLFDRLVASGRIRVIEPARFGARVIEITASGARTAAQRGV